MLFLSKKGALYLLDLFLQELIYQEIRSAVCLMYEMKGEKGWKILEASVMFLFTCMEKKGIFVSRCYKIGVNLIINDSPQFYSKFYFL